MITAPLPLDEDARLRALRQLDILDTDPEEAFDRISRLAAFAFGMPIVLISLVDEKRQWFKSHHGLEACETPRSVSFCAHAVLSKRMLVVEDALDDERFLDNPLVTGAPNIRFYAGSPLRLNDGQVVGTLCLIDSQPRTFDDAQGAMLAEFARLVERELELRRQLIRARTAHERDRRSLAISEARFRTVFQRTPIGKAVVDLDGRFLDVNQTFSEIIGYDESELRERTFMSVTHPADVAADLALCAELVAGRQASYAIEKRYLRPDGGTVWVNLAVSLVRDVSGAPLHFIAAMQDISSRKKSEEALRNYHVELEERVRERTAELRRSRDALQTITDNLPALIAVVDRDLRYQFNNETFRRVFGVDPAALRGRSLSEMLRPEIFEQLQPLFARALAGERVSCDEVRYMADADRIWSATYIPAKRDGKVTGFYIMAHDVTEQHLSEQRLRESALVDPLTGLANRRALQDALSELRAGGEPFALFFIDMDGFKAVNDRYGHDVGDALLKEIADRIAATVRTGDVVSRLGGDEFVVASRGVDDARTGERIAAAICREVSKAFVIAGRVIETSASVGVVLAGAAGAASVMGAASMVLSTGAENKALADDPLCLADAAMYEAKRAGRNTWRIAPSAEMMAAMDV
ncbi:PAS domain S-box protein [Paraburkholderia lycopersici]|uniref:PAS domain S-box-containing protein/diguanylate cyclase (GGDEF) domain-containing protein n=1 Tax=Paraburkholderia lycopersici TaxID=416944 RepID=A0A1G6MCN4_9BURK|nr:PAS domain S-box protein [Paraburkholderia lycopersici]SDC52746.1 PAS domain S-box-containing protein/diguanylate cyclase (GGDEF) domain-containing protein [Paraburkholderia lycopersici]